MIRFCPNCQTERPLSDVVCEGVIGDKPCHWDLSGEPIRAAGWQPPQIVETLAPPSPEARVCPNGHPVNDGDVMCFECGAELQNDAPSDAPTLEDVTDLIEEVTTPTVIDGWQLERDLQEPSEANERFTAVHTETNLQAILTLYRTGAEPDPTVYDVLRSLQDHAPKIISVGRWLDRAYEVIEDVKGGTLTELGFFANNLDLTKSVVSEIGRALHSFSESGLRHRDLRPEKILIRSREPLDLVITGFGSARLSDFDLDLVSPLETTWYTAPEALAGGVAAASDWWSLGMILLEGATQGQCFEGINKQAFLIHALTNGVSVPTHLDPTIHDLLRGLLTLDRRQRWQWTEVSAWLKGDYVPPTTTTVSGTETTTDAAITLAGKMYRRPSTFALAAAAEEHWNEALSLFVRGVITTWVEALNLDAKTQASIRNLRHLEDVSDDFRFALTLKLLNPAMPLAYRGDIVSPGWLMNHLAEGYDLITGPVPDVLGNLETDNWLLRLKTRANTVRAKAQQLDITLNEEELRVHLLSTSKVRLNALWESRRRLLPDTTSPGIASLLEHRQITEEDLILLLSANSGQYRTTENILNEASSLASNAGVTTFDRAEAESLLSHSRRDIFCLVDERLEGFARCGVVRVDEWADQFRLERRMPLSRALALLAVSASAWTKPPKQAYVSTILDYFAKKVTGSVLRGPLSRMLVSRTSARVDLTELGSERRDALSLLSHLLGRSDLTVDIDPGVFGESDALERRLRSLYSHATLYRRDTGIDGLYLGFPFLLMQDARGNTRPRIAPVLLFPIKLNPEVGSRGHISIAFDRDREEVRLNPALEVLLGPQAAGRWKKIAEDVLGRTSLTIADIMDAFGTEVEVRGRSLTRLPSGDVKVARNHAELACAAVLFHLAYMGQAIGEDLRQLKAVPSVGTGLETALRVTEETPAPNVTRIIPENKKYFTTASDPSQEKAVFEARTAPGVLIEGPPGTGKSQTIVNMIGDAIGEKKSLLVVCQKQAALDVVYKRLETEGLAGRVVMITDVNRDREPIVRSVREQLESMSRQANNLSTWRQQREQYAARIEALEGDLDQHYLATYHSDDGTGMSYRVILGELIALEGDSRPLIDVPSLRSLLSGLDLSSVAKIEETCAPLAKYWLPAHYEASVLAAFKPFTPDTTTNKAITSRLNTFVEAEKKRIDVFQNTLNALSHANPTPLQEWLSLHQAVFQDMKKSTRSNLTKWLELFRNEKRGELLIDEFDAIIQSLSTLDERGYHTSLSPLATNLSDQDLQEIIVLATLFLKPVSFFGKLNPRRRSKLQRFKQLLAMRGIIRNVELTPSYVTSLLQAAELESRLRPIRWKLANVIVVVGGSREKLADLPSAHLPKYASHYRDSLNEIQKLVQIIDSCPSPNELEAALMLGTPEAFAFFISRAEQMFARFEARHQSHKSLADLSAWFEDSWITERHITIDQGDPNNEALASILNALPTLEAYQLFRIRAARLEARDFAVFAELRDVEEALSQLPKADLEHEVRRVIRREARLAWKTTMENNNPTLLDEISETENKIKELSKADAEMRRLNRELLVKDIDMTRLRSLRDWEDITRLRGQRARRLREFIERGSELGLMALRPVWLMNPDVASRVLPLKAGMFDTVIYDEASQMPVEYALPTLYRGKVMIVSGDEKQMPPTSFFSSRVENEEADQFEEEPDEMASEEEVNTYLETWNRREIKDCPDLLQLARAVLPVTTLQVHYRSKYRELINFSNASFYSNQLSVPVQHPREEVRRIRPLELINVDGVYQEQTNPSEADKIVELLTDLWSRSSHTRPSVGVVTFNRKQADLIEEVLESQAEEDTVFRAALTEERERIIDGEDMSFFVKNVENVQGDERDIIIFSSTFGRNAQGTFRRNFGVLGQRGGERRLNVAVTRAREKIFLVTSMPIHEISDMLTTRRAPSSPRDYLQAYFEYARALSAGEFESGQTLLSRLSTERIVKREQDSPDDGFLKSVAHFIRSLGWEPSKPNEHGLFSVDFAIEDPRTGLYGIGIECDTPHHQILAKARARELWRHQVLQQSLKNVHRVSLRGWFQNGEEERHQLREAIKRALE